MLKNAFISFLLCFSSYFCMAQSSYRLEVMGVAQDGGYPQAGCEKECCSILFDSNHVMTFVSSLMVYDKENHDAWFFDCGPDFANHLNRGVQSGVGKKVFQRNPLRLQGIFLTHAHIGHYLGLAQLGREVIGADSVPIYCMPRMKEFLENNGPWSQLVELGNIKIEDLENQKLIQVQRGFSIVPAIVPHRDEFSETVAFMIYGPNKKVLYLPDIDKWEKWDLNLKLVLKDVDYAFIDATFYDDDELPGRDMSEIPHPFVVETMELLKDIDVKEKGKVHFIHMNHTNPLLWDEKVKKKLEKKGFHVAMQGMTVDL